MKIENLKHGSLFKREFYLKDVKIDLRNDFFVYSITMNEKTLEIFFKSEKKDIQNLQIIFYDYKLLHSKSYCKNFNQLEANFIDLIRNNWDDITGYIEKEEEMLISIYFENDLEYITLTCKYFNIDFID
ncbi:hypothetical protein [Campylobacter insulaenigrae]|uniref:hypothetical protein n=1 Tax=Campylobacter insulaenigrae TaxID=260714 RepID=UPI002152A15D|nr:hypothetical protein [Campylobacter insulaenigrae]MCR6571534.1 hypothetical protein [Campylobacter insulaenigrae]MCR6574711.1 hypothetical protein [Campylobacter insulaenigrae]MCR6577781.1 hypothetical protein [Campylobacter insulaenigrae]MCR6583892.1 hypothetical protein [Campylobacter insulaenigrae]MCR6585419.1 hypothetical protein [Campylobacter insulaenigrae]